MENYLHSLALHQDIHISCGHTIRECYENKALVDHLQRYTGTDYIQKSLLDSIFIIPWIFSGHSYPNYESSTV